MAPQLHRPDAGQSCAVHVGHRPRLHGRSWQRCRPRCTQPLAASSAVVNAAQPESTLIVGGGPSGLACAAMLEGLGWRNIRVLDRLARPKPSQDGLWGTADRSYNLGVTTRGRPLLNALGVTPRIRAASTPLLYRSQWTPQNPEGDRASRMTESDSHQEPTLLLQRDRLVACLHEHVEENCEHVSIEHGVTVHDVSVRDDGHVEARWRRADGSEGASEAQFLVGADGAGGALARAVGRYTPRVNNVALKPIPKSERVYRTLMMPLPEGEEWSNCSSYSQRSPGGRVLECLPTKEGTLIGLVLFLADDDDVLALSSPEESRAFLQSEFPALFDIIPDSEIEEFHRRPPGRLPEFRYVGPELHYEDKVVLLGDAIHTVKPYFGLGVNSAFEDVQRLQHKLQEHPDSLGTALREFSRERAPDARALVQMSHTADKGFAFFVLPIILDRIFFGAAPWLFQTSTLRMMQLPERRFSEVQRRKRRDRALQLAIIAAAGVAVAWVVAQLARLLFSAARGMMQGA